MQPPNMSPDGLASAASPGCARPARRVAGAPRKIPIRVSYRATSRSSFRCYGVASRPGYGVRLLRRNMAKLLSRSPGPCIIPSMRRHSEGRHRRWRDRNRAARAGSCSRRASTGKPGLTGSMPRLAAVCSARRRPRTRCRVRFCCGGARSPRCGEIQAIQISRLHGLYCRPARAPEHLQREQRLRLP
jgi:hypothetical protein